jgi:uncharacterized protein (DUF2236 family)
MRAYAGSLYGPDSVAWQLNREGVMLLGGPRALLLQLADPAVAAGVADHSGFERNPFARLVGTLDAMTAIAFGPPELARSTLGRLEALHARVTGSTPAGAPYQASDPVLQWWVLATLIDTVLAVERRYLGRLRPEERERYYAESRRMADAFGIPSILVPEDLGAFRAWMRQRVVTLEVSDQARRLARSILRPPIRFVPPPTFELLELVTVDLLPAPLRAAYGLPWDGRRRALLRVSQVGVRAILPRLPAMFRTLPMTLPGRNFL